MDISLQDLASQFKTEEDKSEIETEVDAAVDPEATPEEVPKVKTKAPVPENVKVVDPVDATPSFSVQELLDQAPAVVEEPDDPITDVDTGLDTQTENALETPIDPRLMERFDAEQLQTVHVMGFHQSTFLEDYHVALYVVLI